VFSCYKDFNLRQRDAAKVFTNIVLVVATVKFIAMLWGGWGQQQIFEHYKYFQVYGKVSLTIKEHWDLLDLGQITSHYVEIAS
jgi:hypothetical protein